MNNSTGGKIKIQAELLNSVPLLQELYDAVSDSVVILNKEREIVFANRSFKNFSKVKSSQTLFGMRLGEALGCVNAFRTKEGCGGSEFCAVCGAINSILAAQKKINEQEARILSRKNDEAYDLLVKATPLKIKREKLTIFTIKDISHEKRRQALERIFFHDVLNTLTSLRLVSESFGGEKNKDFAKIGRLISESIDELTQSIKGQKILNEAEENELSVKPMKLSTRSVVENLLDRYQEMAAENKVKLAADGEAVDVEFTSDPNILVRVLENMIKNAIEASKPQNKVTIGVKTDGKHVYFWVNNAEILPKKTKLQIFQRSFTTKGEGRGLGTYSMKLLSERYLKGQVTFTSDKEKGTTFTAVYPKKI